MYQHDIELIENAPISLSAKPYKAAGIRLQQLKETVTKMVNNGILEIGDSELVSPLFFVMKKAGEAKTACKGRLCIDYRK